MRQHPWEKYPIQVISPEEVVVAEVAGQMDKAAKKEALEVLSGQAKPSWVKALEDEMAYVYPYASVGKYKNKYSVSEIKHDRMEKRHLQTTRVCVRTFEGGDKRDRSSIYRREKDTGGLTRSPTGNGYAQVYGVL